MIGIFHMIGITVYIPKSHKQHSINDFFVSSPFCGHHHHDQKDDEQQNNNGEIR